MFFIKTCIREKKLTHGIVLSYQLYFIINTFRSESKNSIREYGLQVLINISLFYQNIVSFLINLCIILLVYHLRIDIILNLINFNQLDSSIQYTLTPIGTKSLFNITHIGAQPQFNLFPDIGNTRAFQIGIFNGLNLCLTQQTLRIYQNVQFTQIIICNYSIINHFIL